MCSRTAASTPFRYLIRLGHDNALGVLFTFTPKYKLANCLGIAFICHICDITPWLAAHCGVCLLAQLLTRVLFRSFLRLLFDLLIFSPLALASYVEQLAGKSGVPSDNRFMPHSLPNRRALVAHGRRYESRPQGSRSSWCIFTCCSPRYFCSSPASNLHALHGLYKGIHVAAIKPTTL